MKISPRKILPLLATTVFLGSFPGISSSLDATIIVADLADRILRDTTGDGSGNSTGSEATTTAWIGEAFTDADQSRYYLPFGNLSALELEAIENAPNLPNAITLNLSLGTKANIGTTTVDLFGFNNRTTLTGSITDYENAGVTLVMADAMTPASEHVFLQFDITSFAKQEIAGGNDILAFRFQVNPVDAFPNSDGVVSRYTVHTANHANQPFIEVIPEPSTYALFAGIALFGVVLVRRRNLRKRA